MDFVSTIKLFRAASMYDIEGLKTLCCNSLELNISRENVCLLLQMAYARNDQHEKERAMNFFFGHAEELLQSEGIFDLPQDCLLDIFKSDKVNITPEKKFEAAMVWAENNCRQQNVGVNETNIKRLLAPLVNHIKFEDMSLEYFSKNVSNRNILDPSEIIKVFQKLASKGLMARPLGLSDGAANYNLSASSSAGNSATEEMETSGNIRPPVMQMETNPNCSSERVVASGRQGATPLPPRGNNQLNNSRAQPRRRPSTEQAAGAQPLPDGHDDSNCIVLWRFQGILSGKSYLRDNPDAISIIPSHSGQLKGIYLYGSHMRQGFYKVNIKILEDGVVKKSIPNRDLVTNGKDKVHLVMIDPPMHFVAENIYTIEMVMKGPSSYYGRSGKDVVTVDDVTFTFIPNDNALNGTNTEIGQFPGFVFEKDES